MAAPPVDPLRRARPRDSHLRGGMTDRALLAARHQTRPAFGWHRGITVGHEGQVLSRGSIRPGDGPPCALRGSGGASGPAPLLFSQAEAGAVVRGVTAGEFDDPGWLTSWPGRPAPRPAGARR